MNALETLLVEHLAEVIIFAAVGVCLLGMIPSIALRIGGREPAQRGESPSERHARLDAEARERIALSRPTSSNRKAGRTGAPR